MHRLFHYFKIYGHLQLCQPKHSSSRAIFLCDSALLRGLFRMSTVYIHWHCWWGCSRHLLLGELVKPSIVIFGQNILNQFDALEQRKLLTLELPVVIYHRGNWKSNKSESESEADSHGARKTRWEMRENSFSYILGCFWSYS